MHGLPFCQMFAASCSGIGWHFFRPCRGGRSGFSAASAFTALASRVIFLTMRGGSKLSDL
jgi:hypothetical protein